MPTHYEDYESFEKPVSDEALLVPPDLLLNVDAPTTKGRYPLYMQQMLPAIKAQEYEVEERLVFHFIIHSHRWHYLWRPRSA